MLFLSFFFFFFFFFNDTATTEIYTTANTLSLHDALPISKILAVQLRFSFKSNSRRTPWIFEIGRAHVELQSLAVISYAVFCLKKKKQKDRIQKARSKNAESHKTETKSYRT